MHLLVFKHNLNFIVVTVKNEDCPVCAMLTAGLINPF